jgi:hypothetical protein
VRQRGLTDVRGERPGRRACAVACQSNSPVARQSRRQLQRQALILTLHRE